MERNSTVTFFRLWSRAPLTSAAASTRDQALEAHADVLSSRRGRRGQRVGALDRPGVPSKTIRPRARRPGPVDRRSPRASPLDRPRRRAVAGIAQAGIARRCGHVARGQADRGSRANGVDQRRSQRLRQVMRALAARERAALASSVSSDDDVASSAGWFHFVGRLERLVEQAAAAEAIEYPGMRSIGAIGGQRDPGHASSCSRTRRATGRKPFGGAHHRVGVFLGDEAQQRLELEGGAAARRGTACSCVLDRSPRRSIL